MTTLNDPGGAPSPRSAADTGTHCSFSSAHLWGNS